MSVFSGSASSIVMCFFLLRIGSLPVLDDNLLFLGSQIDRNSVSQCLIELVDVVTSDIVLPLGDKLSLHDI